MTEFNKGSQGYRPFTPQSLRIISCAGPEACPVEMDSLYYQLPERVSPEIVSISNYQIWAESGWKEQHGTYQACKRFNDKLPEEVGELVQANRILMQGGIDLDTAVHNMVSEMGDVIWCATALASNSSSDIDSGFKTLLFDYVSGIKRYENGEEVSIPWREQAARMATNPKDIAICDVDRLIDQGFEPLSSTYRHLLDGEPDLSVSEHIELLKFDAVFLRSTVEQQYNYGEENSIIMPERYDELAKNIARMVAGVYLNIAYIANKRLGISLSEVIGENVRKINNRIQAGLVDKTDGIRDKETL